MAKTKKTTESIGAAVQPVPPEKVHELLGLPAPYESPKPPPDWPGYLTVWDPGRSILDLRKKHWSLFYPMDWYEKLEFVRQTDVQQWRQVRVAPIEPGHPYDHQLFKLPKGDEVPQVRVIVTMLVVHFLATGERLGIGRLRCRDVLPSKRRVLIGTFSQLGLDVGSCFDEYTSPVIGLAAVSPVRRR